MKLTNINITQKGSNTAEELTLDQIDILAKLAQDNRITSRLTGRIKSKTGTCYVDSYNAIAEKNATAYWNLLFDPAINEDKRYVRFKDINVFNMILQKANSKGVGDGQALTAIDCAQFVNSDFKEFFRNKKDVSSFNEFQYFTGVNKLSNYSFSQCSLTEIKFPDSLVEIGGGFSSGGPSRAYGQFDRVPLRNLDLNNVVRIGSWAFSSESMDLENPIHLDGVVIDLSKIQYLDEYSFYGAENVVLTSSISNPGLQMIQPFVRTKFVPTYTSQYGEKYTKIVLPDGYKGDTSKNEFKEVLFVHCVYPESYIGVFQCEAFRANEETTSQYNKSTIIDIRATNDSFSLREACLGIQFWAKNSTSIYGLFLHKTDKAPQTNGKFGFSTYSYSTKGAKIFIPKGCRSLYLQDENFNYFATNEDNDKDQTGLYEWDYENYPEIPTTPKEINALYGRAWQRQF